LYALVARTRDDAAVRHVFAIKGREADKPLPLLVADAAMAERIAFLGETARALTRRFWPGALTVVVEKRPGFDSLALAGGNTVALRVPDHPIALDVIRRLGEPVTATSANLSGGPDPDSADEVRQQIGDAIDFILDAGACPVGVASTIVDCTGDDIAILRPGAISEAAIRAALAEARS
jgi:L-threonylcarbamoyladenylate synthase